MNTCSENELHELGVGRLYSPHLCLVANYAGLSAHGVLRYREWIEEQRLKNKNPAAIARELHEAFPNG